MTIELSNDKNYPYVIRDAWGGAVYLTETNLSELEKKIKEIKALTDDDECEDNYEPDVDECGFDPYEGCYTYDC